MSVQANAEGQVTLPPGLHPQDQSWPPWEPSPHQTGAAESAQKYAPGRQPFSTENGFALPTYQRAAKQWTGKTYTLQQNNTLQLAGQLTGRVSVTVYVPTGAANPALINHDRGKVDAGDGIILAAGTSITLATEDSVYGAGSGGATTVAVVDLFNPPTVYPE